MPTHHLYPLANRRLLPIMATTQEYGPALKARGLTPLITGVGPVEAALTLTHTLAQLQAQNMLPDLILALGSSGSQQLAHGGIYQASHFSYRDMDASAFGFPKGHTPFSSHPPILDAAFLLPNLPSARLSTGATVIHGEGYASIAEDMVDMESYAYARTARHFHIPFIALRGISDGNHPLEGYQSWESLLGLLDQRLAETLTQLETHLLAQEKAA